MQIVFRNLFLRSLWGGFAVTLLSSLQHSSLARETNATEPFPADAEKLEADAFEKLAAKVKPSVAVIESADRVGREGGKGTGFVVRADGVIATNFHVIGEHRSFRVKFADGKSYEPKAILAVDRERDLALVKIDAQDLPTLPLGDSDLLKPGQGILALGNPLGFSYSVSRGVVAALRELEPGDGKNMVQVAIPIEPGSSGSPTLDLGGKVVAVLAIKSGGAMGFGIPVNALKRLLANPNPISMKHWLTIGALDSGEWESILGGNWRQRAGKIMASGMGTGFGGRMLCLSKEKVPAIPYEIEVEVKLEDESGAAGLVFHSDGGEIHYGFYPTNGSLRLTRFEGPTVFNWTILQTVPSEAYKPGEWNRIRASLGKDGKLICSVNGQAVIELADKGLTKGRVGLCKFRQPGAEFRRFRFAESLPASEIPEALASKVRKISRSLTDDGKIPPEELAKLTAIGKPASQILMDKAKDLEEEASRVRKLAKEVRERSSIKDLVVSLHHDDEKSINLFLAALL
ncbi:MAG: trypsin-like peptidase domain-containing protein, partial [Opitutales bacterium]